jgi:hypothetical protein
MTFKLIIEKVTGGYILTTESTDGVERGVIGIADPVLDSLGVFNIIEKAVGYTILNKIDFKTTDKHVVLNVECYGDVAQDGVETCNPHWKPSEEQMQELYKMVCECRPADTQLLSDIYWGLKSLL